MNKALIIVIGSLLLFSGFVYAETQTGLTEYKLLEPLPGVGLPTDSSKATAETYIAGLFKLLIAAAGVIAVLRLIYAGVIYMSSDAFNNKSEAKGIIQETFWGLGFILTAWLIVALILPTKCRDGSTDKFCFNLSLPTEKLPSPITPIGGIPMTPEEIAADKQVRTRLQGAGVSINSGPCLQGQTRGCTNLNGLPEGTIQYVTQLKKDCNCSIAITGGTEGGHRTHGPGKPPVDLRYDYTLRAWLTSKRYIDSSGNGTVPVSSGRSMRFLFEAAGVDNSTQNHWHIF